MEGTKKADIMVVAGAVIVILLASLVWFGMPGLRTILALILLYAVPCYLLMESLDMDGYEKAFFSFFISLGIIPTIVWFVDRIVPSLRLSILVTTTLVIIAGFLLWQRKKAGKKQ